MIYILMYRKLKGRDMRRLKMFLKREEGVTVVEYAVLVTLIILALLGAIGTFSGTLQELWSSFTGAFE